MNFATFFFDIPFSLLLLIILLFVGFVSYYILYRTTFGFRFRYRNNPVVKNNGEDRFEPLTEFLRLTDREDVETITEIGIIEQELEKEGMKLTNLVKARVYADPNSDRWLAFDVVVEGSKDQYVVYFDKGVYVCPADIVSKAYTRVVYRHLSFSAHLEDFVMKLIIDRGSEHEAYVIELPLMTEVDITNQETE